MSIKITALPAATTLADTDLFPVSQSSGSVTNKALWSSMVAAVIAASNASVVSSATYTATGPTSISTIAFSNTTGLFAGMPITVVQSAVAKYYIITTVTANTSIAVAGPALTLATAIDSIATLPVSRVVQLDFLCPGPYDGAGTTVGLIARNNKTRFRWNMPKAKLVRAAFMHNTVGSGTQPKVNATINANAVFTDNTNAGATMPGTTAWVSIGDGTASSSNYSITNGQEVELALTAGANLDARDLTASLIFILE